MSTEEKNRVINLLDMVGKYWAIITAFISGIALVVSFLLKWAMYIYAKAFYDFWTIPDYYIQSSNENTVFEFLLIIVAVIVFMFIAYIYFGCLEKSKKEKKHISMILLIMLVPFLWYFTMMVLMNMDGYSWRDLLFFTFTKGYTLLGYIILFSVVIYLVGYGAFMSVLMLLEMADSIKNVRLNELNGKKIMLMISFLFVVWLIVCWSIYSSKLSTSETGKELEIVEIEAAQYVIIAEYGDQWIVKECILNDDTVIVNKDDYSCIEIDGYSVRHFENSIENVDALVDYDEFEKMK